MSKAASGSGVPDGGASLGFAGAPFLLGSALMVVAIAVACTIDPASGRGAHLAPLLSSDEEAADCFTHFADLPAPNTVPHLAALFLQ